MGGKKKRNKHFNIFYIIIKSIKKKNERKGEARKYQECHTAVAAKSLQSSVSVPRIICSHCNPIDMHV
jgi:hypothetical protein